MYGSGVKPLKGSGTRWIDHNIRSMGGVIKKLWLYIEPLNSCVATTKNSTARATVEGKLRKFVDAKVLLRAAFFRGVLAEAKRFSLKKHQRD